MGKKRRTFSSKQKAKIALEALREREPLVEIAKKHTVHPNQVSNWKKTAIAGLEEIFTDKRKALDKKKEHELLTTDLYNQIGQLHMELEWLKKKIGEL